MTRRGAHGTACVAGPGRAGDPGPRRVAHPPHEGLSGARGWEVVPARPRPARPAPAWRRDASRKGGEAGSVRRVAKGETFH